MNSVAGLLSDRIQVNSLLIVLCFVSVLALSSQSAASYSTYLLALAMLFTLNQWTDVFRVRLAWLIVGLLGYLSLSGFWSEPFVLRDALSTWGRALLIGFFVVAFAECQLRGQVRRWLGRALALVGSVAAVVALLGWYNLPSGPAAQMSGAGQLDNPVIMALIFGVILLVVLDTVLTDGSKPWRLVGVACLPVLIAVVYLSGSRIAWVSVLIGTLVFVGSHVVHDRQKFALTMASLAVLLVALIGPLIVNESTSEMLIPEGDAYRLGVWMEAMSGIRQQLWFGWGILTDDTLTVAGSDFLHAHNMYLAVAFQGGIVGLLLLFAVIAEGIRGLGRNYHDV
ncbi:MAG: O-antigen ligase family protein, partial [Gammaproteobacteria bacterium]|nr:O-antigen ligase family protein [Gammaproteobacteria bacterium]